MIPIAGDEVTEAIIHKYLVDFQNSGKHKNAGGNGGEYYLYRYHRSHTQL